MAVSLAMGARVPAAADVVSGAGVVATRLVVSEVTVLDEVEDGLEVEVLLVELDDLVDVDLVEVVFSAIVDVLVLYPAMLPEKVASSVRYLVRTTVLGPVPDLALIYGWWCTR